MLHLTFLRPVRKYYNNVINVEQNSYETLLKIANSHNSDNANYFKNNSNMAYNNMGLSMNMKRNPFFG